MSLGDLLDGHPAGRAEPLVHTIDSAWTKAEVLADVEALAGRLGDVAARPVAVVADGVEALIGMFAAWRAAAVHVPVNPRQPDRAVDTQVERADPAAVVRAGQVTELRGATTHQAGTAMVLWTSGTTGEPAPVVHSHDAYIELIDRVLEPLRSKSSDRTPSPNLVPVSMALNAGIYNALFGLRAGAPLVLMDRFGPGAFAALVGRHGIRSTVLPPAAIAMLNDSGVRDLGPLRYVRSITAPLSPFQARRFTDRFGVTVLNGYGQAEIGEVIGWTASEARDHPDKVGAAGRAHPGVAVRLEAPDGDGIGELLVRPPHRADGLDGRVTPNGFVRTGDLARIDADGFVWIEGRIGDVINRGGNKVFPAEVEEVLAAVPGVSDVAVVAVSDGRLGEVPVAFVVGDAADGALVAACRAHLAPYKVPVRWERVDAVPRNAAGKILRRELA